MFAMVFTFRAKAGEEDASRAARGLAAHAASLGPGFRNDALPLEGLRYDRNSDPVCVIRHSTTAYRPWIRRAGVWLSSERSARSCYSGGRAA